MFKKEPKEYTGKSGGLFYFTSLVFLAILTAVLFPACVKLFVIKGGFWQLLYFISGMTLGCFSSYLLFPASIKIFIHELKHNIVAGLAGNKVKEINVGRDSGFVKYEFTADTKQFNAFISLAPYYLPFFTIIATPIAYFFAPTLQSERFIISLALGIDYLLNFEDMGPHQTDFSNLNGGFFLGQFYAICMNITVFFLTTTWSIHGSKGFLFILDYLLQTGFFIYSQVQNFSRF